MSNSSLNSSQTNTLDQTNASDNYQGHKELSHRQLSALYKATKVLLSTLDIETLLGQILDSVAVALPATNKGMLHLIARDTGQLEMRAVLGYTDSDPRIRKFTFPGKKGYIAQAVSERRPLLITRAQTDLLVTNADKPQTDDKAFATESAIVAPLILKDHVIGALSLESSHREAFTEADLQLAESFAALATAAIRNAMLHAEVQRQAITDPLTGIYNRRGFFELGQREIERSHRFERSLSAMMLDIDDFKTINDARGHAVGDQILRLVAQQCSSNVRSVDLVGRYGGDEFAILLPEIDLFVAANVADRLRQSVSELYVPLGGETLTLTISVGVTKATSETPDLESLLNRADIALYTAKQGGRNRVEVR